MEHLKSGSVTIGATNYVISYVLPIVIKEFSKLYPKIEINLTETKSLELEKMLSDEEIDLFIDSFDFAPTTEECYPLLKEKILLAVPSNFECNKGLGKYRYTPGGECPKVSAKHFENENFILLKNGNNMHKHAMQIFKKADIAPNVIYKLDQLSTAYNLTMLGSGVCFLTDTVFKINPVPDNIVLYDLEESETRTLYIAKKKTRFLSHAMSEFIEISKQTIK
ncbi:MAG: LysR family transcriptional regulator substrate-binding protein [Acutalibacteraceae bacterium]|nr:LysR family transcriptional regulator substrate-binding protein [Acutalibacteraceae bacterium]